MKNPTFASVHPSLRAHQSLLTPAATAVLALLTLAGLLAAPGRASAQNGIPSAINYQGKLTDNLGHPVANGFYQVWFRIWDNPTQSGAGDYIWGRSFPLNVVSNGMFNVLLTDSGAPVNVPGTPAVSSLLGAFEGPSRYLGLTIVANPQGAVTTPAEISPRQQLVAAPFAIHTYNATVAASAVFATNAYQSLYASSAGATPFYATNGLQVAGAAVLNNGVTVTGTTTLDGSLNLDAATSSYGGFVPVRGIIMWSGTTAPANWALCDGSIQNGIQTPDLRGRFVLGSGSGAGLTSRTLNAFGGSEAQTLSIAQMPSHTHTLGVNTVGYSAAWAGNVTATGAPQGNPFKNNESQWFTTDATGGGQSFAIMPPYYALAYIIRVK